MNRIKTIIIATFLLSCAQPSYAQAFQDMDRMILHCVLEYTKEEPYITTGWNRLLGRINTNKCKKADAWWLEKEGLSWSFCRNYQDTLSMRKVFMISRENPEGMNLGLRYKLIKGIKAIRVSIKIDGSSIIIAIQPFAAYWRRPFLEVRKKDDGTRSVRILQGGVISLVGVPSGEKYRFDFSPEDNGWVITPKDPNKRAQNDKYYKYYH